MKYLKKSWILRFDIIYTAIWVTDSGISLWNLTFPAAGIFFKFMHLYQKESERGENKKSTEPYLKNVCHYWKNVWR